MRAVTVTGALMSLSIDGRPVEGVPVTLGPQELRFALTCDGRVELTDGLGQPVVLKANGWPVPTPGLNPATLELCTPVDLPSRA
jgi:hypothetical protein